MQKRTIAALAGSVIALTALGGTAAQAGGLVGSKDIKDNSVRSVDIHDGAVHSVDLSKGVQTKLNRITQDGVAGPQGTPGTDGRDGVDGKDGRNGTDGADGTDGTNAYEGAYYAVAFYNVGDTNQGAIASVACQSVDDHAVSGGVQTLGLEGGHPAAVASSFPGRMDWSTNTPKENRLDGWIVQFDADTAPLKTKVWALCMPDTQIPIVETFRQTD